MERIGKHFGRTVFYVDLASEPVTFVDQLENWICFGIASEVYPSELAEAFIRCALLSGMLEFKAQGANGEELHHLCDMVMVSLEIDEGHSEFDAVTTGDADTDLANAFWECYFATALPDRADFDHLNIVCVSFDGNDYRSALREVLDQFEAGWIPDD